MRDTSRHRWAEPGAEEVGENVYRIPLPMPGDGLRAVNVYAFTQGDGLTIIDSGWALPQSRTALVEGLARLGRSLRDVRRFLVTHLHPDHYAQASALRSELAVSVALGAGELPNVRGLQHVLATGDHPDPRRSMMRRAGATALAECLDPPRVPADARQTWAGPDEWLADGQAMSVGDTRLTVVATPGHTRGHVVFHDEDARLLFSGDHVLPQITPSIGLEIAETRWPLRDYLDSLRLLKSRPDARLLPAHGPVATSAHRRVDELLDHHETRLAEVLTSVRAGASTGWEVASALTWTYRELALHELDLRNRSMAVHETMAHLDVLVLRDELVVTTIEGVDRYATS